MKVYSWVVVLFVIVIGCSNHKQVGEDQGITQININPEKAKQIKRSELFSIEDIIFLKSSEKNIIGEVRDFYVCDTFMIIVSDSVSLYDFQGKFIRNLSSKGKGPGEFLSVNGINNSSEGFIINDRSGKKIIHLSGKGSLIGETKTGVFGQAFCQNNGFNWIYAGNEINEENKRLFLYSNEFKFVDAAFDIDNHARKFMNFMDKTNFYQYKDSLRFLYSFDDNVYSISEKNNRIEVLKRYKVDFGKYGIPASIFEGNYSDSYEFSMKLRGSNFAYRIMGYIENDQNVIFAYWFKDDIQIAVYNKKTGNTYSIKEINDDIIFKGLKCKPADEYFSYYYSNGTLYYIIYPFQINDQISELERQDLLGINNDNSILDRIKKGISASQEPIIIKFKLII